MKSKEILNIPKSKMKGKIVCFPTDTVYGVGAIINDVEGVNKIYELKHRDPNKPLAVLAPNIESILPYIEYPKVEVFDLMQKYWPGALTIIFNKKEDAGLNINENYKTIGFRIPNSKVAKEILEHFGPMATTSVNLSGTAPLNSYEEILNNFSDQIDYIIEEEENKSNVSSTIVDATKHPFVVLRQGDIKIEEV